ncbi:MAG: alpha/beta hydrolase [Gammaproteobacteria bacterium]|nr:MAG: alpha/beta hydrolase [Gammaproteobacteria bacterium]TLZ03488.1 MAG: alpha/beta hydrolase [Gammaproteobacteria bacterium]TLZ17354.1 MAG: alpha/beta hydrolase [Gammaproteobacteria bacterium]TLZ30578.1 MAG: alpha/beta hydrolase [Gammaproteobacteria bacterium]TLZ42013.1 MAG: alpha/beta hydrolase [Gammaproteobacteria bacterium]
MACYRADGWNVSLRERRPRLAEYWFDSHDGLRLYSRVYAAAADSPVVLCLHGLMRNSRDFGALAAQLAARYRVIVPDVRGRGFSARDPNFNNYQIPVYLQDVLTLLAGLGAARVSIIGTSMGGLMAMLLAATHPKLVSRIVLNDVGPQVDPAGLERIRGYAGQAAPVRSWPEAIAQLRADYAAAWPNLSDARWDEIARLSYRANAQGVPEVDADPLIREPLKSSAAAAPDLWPLWRSLARVPILVIRGAHSDILSVTTLARMQRERPGLEVLTVANRGHAPLLDEPGCVAAIERFLAGA